MSKTKCDNLDWGLYDPEAHLADKEISEYLIALIDQEYHALLAEAAKHDIPKSGLKPCPFCGGEVIEDWSACAEIHGDCYQYGWIECPTCDYELTLFDGCTDNVPAAQILKDKWNKRV